MASDFVWALPSKMSPEERAGYLAGAIQPEVIQVRNGHIKLDVVHSLFGAFDDKLDDGIWDDDRAASDRWLAPRLHFALRLTRAEASDRGLWQWLALEKPAYVHWRWQDSEGFVADNRWWGEIHKQALARLWWGAELFRDGASYTPVVQAFVKQDLPNSYLHRPLIRCRSLALAIVEELSPMTGTMRSSDEINDLARVLNLATAGAPPEAETGYQMDGSAAFTAWAASTPDMPDSWADLPGGPAAEDTTAASRDGGKSIVNRGAKYANFAVD
jgi:hypothetical protein